MSNLVNIQNIQGDPMKILHSPKEIPIHYFYFAWKKAVHHMRTSDAIYDPFEVEEFQRNVDDNLLKLQQEIKSLGYKLQQPIPYFTPKSLKDNTPRVRPMVHFSFKDQIAWAAVILALGEWFDTGEDIGYRIPLHMTKERNAYPWMVKWSYNNRLKRMMQEDELSGNSRRLFIHYNHKSLYESYQWGLRNLREERKQQFETVRQRFANAYYGEADIQEFYPTLKIKYILSAIEQRLIHLVNHEIIDGCCKEDWLQLLGSMLDISHIDFSETFSHPMDQKSVKILSETILGKFDIEELCNHLKETLPIGLIASGFLSNCALTEHFDRPLDQFIERVSQKKYVAHQAFITRYTDDMMIVASNPQLVHCIMTRAHRLLKRMGIFFSPDKCNPNGFLKSEDKTKVDKTKVTSPTDQLLKKIPIIRKRDTIPGSTAVIEKLSQFSDRKLWAMNHEQLLKYMGEMKQLLDTKFDPTEIKDETKSVFAAWRLRSSVHEAMSRKLPFSFQTMKESLRNSVYRYPHKFSFIEIYIMYLFENSSEDDFTHDFLSFIQCFQQNASPKIGYDGDALGDVGAYLRTTLMYAIANHWGKLSPKMRDKTNGIIFDNISTWYIEPPVWHEKAAMYWMAAVTNMKRDFGAVSPTPVANEPPCVRHMYRVFKATIRDGEAAYTMTDSGPDSRYSPDNISVIRTIGHIFSLREQPGHEKDTEREQWILWCWKTFDQHLRISSDSTYQRCVFELISLDPDLAPKEAFLTLFHVEYSNTLYNNVLHFMDDIVDQWLDYPKGSKRIDRFIEALHHVEKNMLANTPVLMYVKKRIVNLGWIKIHICKSKNGISRLPDQLADKLRSDRNEIVPSLLDWLSVTRSTSLSKNDRLTHQLSEYEILSIIARVKANESNDPIRAARLRNILIKPSDWSAWRKAVIDSRESEFQLPILTTVNEHEDLADPDLHFINQAIQYTLKLHADSNFAKYFPYSVLLCQLYAQEALKGSIFELQQLLSWRGASYIIRQCGAPSSPIIALITSTINHFFWFYKEHYESLGNIQIPYRSCISEDIMDVNQFFNVIDQTRIESKHRFLCWEQGIIELRLELIDDWMVND